MIRLTIAAIALLFLSTATLASAQSQPYVISTYAGGVPPPTPAPGLNMEIGSVQSVAADAAGNTYFISLNCVFKLDQNGVVTRIAGNARAGYSGDGGLATSAQLRLESTLLRWYLNPPGLTVDNIGNVYVADNGNYRIRKISPDGSITTVAGNGTPGFSGDGGPATSAQLSSVGGLAVDMAGNLWISDSGANRIREVTPDGSIATVAGTGVCGFSGDRAPAIAAQLCVPSGIAADSAGNVFIADSGNGRVRRISNDGIITSWPDVAGIAEYAYFACRQLCLPGTVAVDHAGNVFVNTLVDEGFDIVWHLVRKISPSGVITTVAGYDCLWPCNTRADGTTATKTFLSGPLGLAVDNAGNLLIADGSGQRVRKVSPDGAIATVAGNGQRFFSGDGGPATSAQLAQPEGVAVDRGGSVFIADYVGCRIRRVTPDGIIATVAGNGTYGFSGDGGPAINAQMAPYSVTLDAAGNIFFFDIPNRSVRKVSLDGIITTVAIVGGNNYFVAVDSAGDLFIADPKATLNTISKVSPDGTISAVAGNGQIWQSGFSGDGGPATSAQLAFPGGVAVDSAHNVYIADTGNNRIRKVTPDGIITTIAGNGIRGFSGDGGPATSAQLAFPYGVAVDGAHNVYIADTENNRIRKISADGIIRTIAGDGTAGYSGDDGPAIQASLSMPIALAVDDAGNVYVPGANAIRILRPVPAHRRVPRD